MDSLTDVTALLLLLNKNTIHESHHITFAEGILRASLMLSDSAESPGNTLKFMLKFRCVVTKFPLEFVPQNLGKLYELSKVP